MMVQVIAVLVELKMAEKPVYYAFNVILAIYGMLAFLFVSILLGFHTYLIYNNSTTNEFCKNVW